MCDCMWKLPSGKRWWDVVTFYHLTSLKALMEEASSEKLSLKKRKCDTESREGKIFLYWPIDLTWFSGHWHLESFWTSLHGFAFKRAIITSTSLILDFLNLMLPTYREYCVSFISSLSFKIQFVICALLLSSVLFACLHLSSVLQ